MLYQLNSLKCDVLHWLSRMVCSSLLLFSGLWIAVGGGFISAAYAQEETSTVQMFSFDNTLQEQLYRQMVEELRCPKCQNQNLAGSEAPIAMDLKQKTYDMVKQGKNADDIRAYMIARYGDFITYKPQFKGGTLLLWILPPLLMVFILSVWFVFVKKQRKATLQSLSEQELQQLEQLMSNKHGRGL